LFFQVGSIYHFNLNGIILVLLIAETIKNHKRLTSLLSNEEIIPQKGENMNDLQIFNNEEFGEVRTAVINDEPMFCLIDICKALEIKNATDVAKRLDEDELTRLNLGSRAGETNFITESGLYAVILRSDKPNAKKFRKWVTAEVLPSIRKTGSYGMPKTTGGQIQLLAQGYTELEQKVNDIKDDVSELKENVPLYSCDIDEIQQHVKRRVVNILGGKQSEAYRDNSIRHKTFSDIWTQLKREYGCVSTYKSIKRKYIDDVHEFIDCYVVPKYLDELIHDANAQQSFA
jgi:prophage antirepressor-like protein